MIYDHGANAGSSSVQSYKVRYKYDFATIIIIIIIIIIGYFFVWVKYGIYCHETW
jgi:hypothetical protein